MIFDKQEVFNTVVTHLITQGKAAASPSWGCMYRTEDGRKCAVGCLIPDELYTPDIEGDTVDMYNAAGVLSVMYPEGYDIHLLMDLQKAHDSHLMGGGLSSWAVAMKKIAHTNNLTVPEALANL